MPAKITRNSGVFGVVGHVDASLMTFLGLYAMQHRGLGGCGICTYDIVNSNFNISKGLGLVTEVFSNPEEIQNMLKGKLAIGQCTTFDKTDGITSEILDPSIVYNKNGRFAISFNGNFTNSNILRSRLLDEGVNFQGLLDSEIFINLISKSSKNVLSEKIEDACNQIEGAYAILLLTEDRIYAVRDPYGIKPLSIGRIDETLIFASETCAFDINNNALYMRDVHPGEIIEACNNFDNPELKNSIFFKRTRKTFHCIQEYIYASRPESNVFGMSVDKVRRKLGKNLAIERPATHSRIEEKKVIIIGVPDSSNMSSLAYITETIKSNSYVKIELALTRNQYGNYLGKVYTESELQGRLKYSAIPAVIKDRRVVLIEDSIVGGTTVRWISKLLRECKPLSLDLKVICPPIVDICHYGMSFPQKEKLIFNQFDGDLNKLRDYLGVDSVEFLSLSRFIESLPSGQDSAGNNIGYCTGCLSGKHPIPNEEIQ